MKNCIVVVNIFNKSAQKLVAEIELFLKEKQYMCTIVEFNGQNTIFPDVEYDFVITLGGDGTVLYASRQTIHKNKPIFPVNFGEFGFIAGIQPEEWKDKLEYFFANTQDCTQRSLLYIEVIRDSKRIFHQHALNEVVLKPKVQMKTILLDIDANGIPFGKFKADGLILATATGSTAYSVAAGGPIVDPSLDVILFNPISAFSLSTRPLVLAGDTELKIEVLPSRNTDFMVSIDGQVHFDIQSGDFVVVKQSIEKALLVGCTQDVFYSALRSKFHWSGGPFA